MTARVLLLTVCLMLGAGAVFVPQDWAAMAAIGLGAAFAVMANVLAVDWSLRRHRSQLSMEGGKARGSLLNHAGMQLFMLGLITGSTALLLSRKSVLTEPLSHGLEVAAAAFGIIGILGLGLHLCVRLASPANPLQELRQSIPVKPFRQQVREALEFQRIVGPRLLVPLLALIAICSLIALLGIAVFGGIFWAGWIMAEPFSVVDFEDWPSLMKLGFVGGLIYLSACVASMFLGLFRLVARARRSGHVRVAHAWRDLGLALETVGILGTAGWGLIMTIALGVIGLVSFYLWFLMVEGAQLEPIASSVVSALLFLVVAWAMVVFPQIYVMAVMTRRDCGWMGAMEASLLLVELEGREALGKALLASLLALTVVGIPGAVYLLLAALDGQDLMLAKVLREKTNREIREAMEEISAQNTGRLGKFDELLKKGRYLDALNGYQMYLRTHREDAEATRGEAIAYLHMGNPRARESLERWERLDPSSEEAKRYLAEFNAGLWKETGERFLEADRRCTQRIGVGVSGMTAPPRPDGPYKPELRND